MTKTYTVQLEQDLNGDLLLPIPQEILDQTGWKEGTVLKFNDCGYNTFVLSEVNQYEPSVDDLLLAMLGSHDFVETWWNSPNAHFGFQCPCDCDREQVYQYVLEHSNQ